MNGEKQKWRKRLLRGAAAVLALVFVLGVMLYAVLFFVGALLIRSHKVRRWEGM